MIEQTFTEDEAAALTRLTARRLRRWRLDFQLLDASGSEPGSGESGWGGVRQPVLYQPTDVVLARFYQALLVAGVSTHELWRKFGRGEHKEVLRHLFPRVFQHPGDNAIAPAKTYLTFRRALKRPLVLAIEAEPADKGLWTFRADPVNVAVMSQKVLGEALILLGNQLVATPEAGLSSVLLSSVQSFGRGVEVPGDDEIILPPRPRRRPGGGLRQSALDHPTSRAARGTKA